MTTPGPRLYPANGLQLTVRINDVGQPSVVVLGAVSNVPAAATAANATLWLNTFWEAFRPLVVGTASCVGATLRDVSRADGQVAEVGPPTNATGSGGAARAVAAACTLVKWTTAQGGRSGKGRTYVPGISASQVNSDGRTYQAGYSATVATAVSAYLTNGALDSAGIQPAVLSFTKGSSATIDQGALAAVVGIQRRRMRA